jgi:hypothetical protein
MGGALPAFPADYVSVSVDVWVVVAFDVVLFVLLLPDLWGAATTRREKRFRPRRLRDFDIPSPPS